MPSLDLIARFIGVDAGAGREFDRLSAKSATTGSALEKMAKAGSFALAGIAVASVKAAGDYQKLTVNLVTGAGETQRNLKMVQDGMLHMAGQVGYSADTLAKAMYTVESAGFHGAAALNVLKTSAEGAKVDNADLTTVVDALTSAMNAYHTPTADAAKVTNTLIASASVGKMHLQDLTAALGTVLPSAAALHVPLAQVGAAMATMTAQGTDATRAATYLRFSIAALANPTSKAQGEMKSLGISSTQVATEIMHGGLPGVFQLLEDAAGRKFPAGSAKYLAALANMVGGTRGLQAVLELTGKHLTTMNTDLGVIQTRVKNAGNSVSDWSDIQHNFNQQLDQFGASLQANAITLGMKLLPVATDLLHVFTDGAHAIHDVTGFFEEDKAAAAALATVIGAALLPRLVAMAGSGFETVALKAMYARDALSKMTGATEESASTTSKFAGMIGRGGMFAAAATVAVGVVSSIDDSMSHTTIDANAMSAALLNLGRTGQISGALTKAFGDNLSNLKSTLGLASSGTDILGFHFHSLGSMLTHTGGDFSDARNKVQSVDDALTQLVEGGNADLAAKAFASISAAAKQQGVSVGTLHSRFSEYYGALQNVTAEQKSGVTPTQDLTHAETALKNAAQGSDQAVQALTTTLDRLVGNTISADQQQNQFASGLRQLRQDLDKSHGSMSRLTADGTASRDAFDSLIQTILSSASANEKLANGGQIARSALQGQIAALKALGSNSPYVIKQIHALEKALHNIPASADGTETGDNFTSSLAQALRAGRPVVGAAANAVGAEVDKNARQALGIHSPSTHAIQTGKWYVKGLAIGMTEGQTEVYLSGEQVAHQLALGLTHGWHGEALKVKDTFTEGLQSALSKMNSSIQTALDQQIAIRKNAAAKLKQIEQQQHQEISSLRSSIASQGDLTNLFGTDANGNPTVANVGQFLGAQVGPLEQFAKDLKWAERHRLSPILLSQIANLGAIQGDQVLRQFMSGQASIGQANAAETSIQRFSGMAAAGVVNSQIIAGGKTFPQLITRDTHKLDLQIALLHDIRDDMRAFVKHPNQHTADHLTVDLRGVAKGRFTKADAKELMKLFREIKHDSGGRVKI